VLQRSETAERLRLVYCRTGDESYCLDMGLIQSIQRYERMQRSPDRDGPLGWLNHQGSRLPVFSMAERLGGSAIGGAAAQGAIVVLRGQTVPWGLAVDRVSRPFDVTPDKVMAVPGPAQSGAFQSVVLTPEGLVLRLLPDQLHRAAHARESAPAPYRKPPVSQFIAAAPQPGTGRVLLFAASGDAATEAALAFGLSFSQVLEVCSGLPHVAVPGARKHVLGMVQWRERPVAVIDIVGLAGLPPVSYERGARVLIVRPGAGAQVIAVPVKTGIRWQTLPLPHQPYPRELPLDLRYVRGVFDIGAEVLLIPDLNAIVETFGTAGPRTQD
jgi:chemotaxis signal transduction protein